MAIKTAGLSDELCLLGELVLGAILIETITQHAVESSGPSLYGLGGYEARLGSMLLGAWDGDKDYLSVHDISFDFQKEFKSVHNISGESVEYDRIVEFYSRHEIAGGFEKEFISHHCINLARRPGSNMAPFQMATYSNEPDEDDGPPEFRIGNAKTGEYVNLTGIPYQFEITMTESQATTWALSLIDPFGLYSPLRLNGPYSNLMDEKPFGADGAFVNPPYGVGISHPSQVTMVAAQSDSGGNSGQAASQVNQYVTKIQLDVVKELFVSAKVGGRSWFFRGPGTSFSSTRNWQTKCFNFCWKGQDYSLLLNKENQTMRTIRSTKFGATKMSQAVGEILGAYGLRYDLSRLQADDFVVPFMNRSNGVPHDWVTQLLQTLMFEWKMVNGTTFTPYYPVPLSTSYPLIYNPQSVTPTFVHDFTQMAIMEENYEASLQAMYNQVIGLRAAQGGTKSYSQEMFAFGDQYSLDFDTPLSAVTYHLDYAVAGNVYSLKYYKGDTLIAVQNIFTGGIGYGNNVLNTGVICGATRVTWTWGVLPGGFIGTGSPGKITFKGVEEVEGWGGKIFGDAPDQDQDNPAPQLRAYAENRALIAQYGLRPIEMSASSLIPSQEVLQKFCERMLFRLSRQARRATYRIPLNPFIEPGSIIREVDYTLGTLNAPLVRDRVVQTVTHSFSNDPANRYTTYSGNEYVETR